ncbi:MAG: hypothetical protein U9Q20_03780 [Campylobacterota bacterium]|nr:hypothetical protein [Campylobacterota bacterium]
MSETRETQIVDESEAIAIEVDENSEQIEPDPKEELKDEVFDNLKLAIIEEKRLLGRFYEFSYEHGNFEYDEMGENMDEADEVLRKTNKIRDKFLNNIQEKLLYIFENIQTNTLTNIITFTLDTKEYQYSVILEVLSDSFNLEVQ